MPFILSETRRRIYAKKMKEFWEDYRRNKIGLVGIAIVLMFVFIAASAPWLTPYHPIKDYGLAESMAMPQWVTWLPQYSDLPPTIHLSVDWPQVSANQSVVDIKRGEGSVVMRYVGSGMNADVYLGMNFSYPYSPPKAFECTFRWEAKPVEEVGYSLELFLVLPGGEKESLWDSYYLYGKKRTTEIPLRKREYESTHVRLLSKDARLLTRFGYDDPLQQLKHNIATETFQKEGEYGLLMHVRFEPEMAEDATCEIHLKDTQFKIKGLVHGILGTDRDGTDILSQMAYGTQISLTVGLLATLIATSIGILVGVVSGYIGGAVDELLMRIVDVFLCIPLLPLLLILMFVFGRNVFYIVFLIGFFTWTGLARVIRSQVLSLREKPFIESAIASGASKSYIMLGQIIPNVLPVAFASMILGIPIAILTEASLSFLGFGDPTLATWGRTLNNAFQSRAFQNLAWWWILPPGLAIMILCLGFVFIGHALDEVVNPRLRRRR